jgi:hypothetical protein
MAGHTFEVTNASKTVESISVQQPVGPMPPQKAWLPGLATPDYCDWLSGKYPRSLLEKTPLPLAKRPAEERGL